MLGLYGKGDSCGIVTDLDDEMDFRNTFAGALFQVIKDNDSSPYLVAQLLELYAEVTCKLRGYKADVRTRTIIEAGEFVTDETSLIAKVNAKGEVSIPEGKANFTVPL